MALITCPECKHQISEHATACPQCGYKLNIVMAQMIKLAEKRGADVTANKLSSFGYTKMTLKSSIFTVLGILLVAFIGVGIFEKADKKETQNKTTDNKTTSAMPGDIAILSVTEGGDIPVASSKEALERLTTLSVAHDNEGIRQLILAGYVWTVPTGTKCRLIDPGLLTYEVRILEGKRSGSTCFVDRGFIAK